MLGFRQANDEPIQSISQCDLAGEARVAAQVRNKIKHDFLGRSACSYPVGPVWINIDVAGGTGTIAAAISVDAWHTVVGGSAHERCARGHFDCVCSPGEAIKSDFGHAKPYLGSNGWKRQYPAGIIALDVMLCDF
jgi:hypothetical protein